MPLPGDVDVVLASELMEAGRAVQRGLVTPDRTTLIASTHRIYSIAEKTALGDGRVDSARCSRTPQRRRSASSASTWPRRPNSRQRHQRGAVRRARRHRRAAVRARRVRGDDRARRRRRGAEPEAFDAAYAGARPRDGDASARGRPLRPTRRPHARRCPARRSADAGPSQRLRVRAVARSRRRGLRRARRAAPRREGMRRLIDYQDPAYAALYLDRVARSPRDPPRRRG